MRLIKILDIINQIERSSFLKIIDNFSSNLRSSNKEIDTILAEGEDQIKNVDNENIVKLFKLTLPQFSNLIKGKLEHNDFHLGILIDILIRDGNSIMSREWFGKLYNDEIKTLKKNLNTFLPKLGDDSKEIELNRKRDYIIYRNCVRTAYYNDELCNREKVITKDEKSVLNTLAKNLSLSVEEIRLINYSIVKLAKIDVDIIINSLKELGVIFFNRKTNTIFVPDEIIWFLRDLVGVELSNKYFRRILRQLKDSELNRVARKHNLDISLSREEKIKQILIQGVSVNNVLLDDIYKDNINKTEKKNYLNELIFKKLDIKLSKVGNTAEERVDRLIDHYKSLEQDEGFGMSIDGYEKLLKDLNAFFPRLNQLVKDEFELQQENTISVDIMSEYNIKPLDILYLLPNSELLEFCNVSGIKSRGNSRQNILANYKDIENLYLENFVLIGKRDINALIENGLNIKESELGLKYEELTKKIFFELGYYVDEKLKKKINTKKGQMDILLNLGNNELFIVECKTIKDKDYNKYSSVSRQLRSYEKQCEKNGHRVLQLLLVSNDFSEDFIAECDCDYEMNLSLLSSEGLLKIMNAFKQSKLDSFPNKLFLKGGKLDEDRIVKALVHR